MNDCSNHKKDVAGISDMKVLAEMIGDLHYETLTILFNYLVIKINEDGHNDWMAGRDQLAAELKCAATQLLKAANNIEKAWQISKPFMKNQNNNS